MISPDQHPLEDRKAAFLEAYEKSELPAAGVPRPSGAHFWAMMLLWENLGNPVSQREMAQFYTDHELGQYDRQVRHKAASGWRLATGNSRTQNMEYNPSYSPDQICLVAMEPNGRFMANRKLQLSSMDWEDKVALFEARRGGCGMCGQKCHSYDRGHLDRRQPMVISNLVPLCSGCNNWLQATDMDAYIETDTLKVRCLLPGSNRFERKRKRNRLTQGL